MKIKKNSKRRKIKHNQELIDKLRESLKSLYVDCKFIEDWT